MQGEEISLLQDQQEKKTKNFFKSGPIDKKKIHV